MIWRLDKYVLGRFLAAFALVMVAWLLLFVLFDLSMRMAAFAREGFSVLRMAHFYLYFVPERLVLLTPLVLILAVAWSIGQLARNNEITAMRAAGISLARISAPLFVVCGLLACAVFVLSERVVTRTHAVIREEKLLLRKKLPKTVVEDEYFYTDDTEGLLHFSRYDVRTKVMSDPDWNRPPTDSSPQLYIKAARAEWLGGLWWLFDVRVHTRHKREGHDEETKVSPLYDKRIMYEWELLPEYISKQKGPEEMMLGELNQAVRRDHVKQPERAREYRLERHERVTMPVLTLLMVPLSFPLVVKLGGRRRHAAVGLGVSLLLCFGYYLFYLAMVAIVRKWVPSFPALVWLPNLTYSVAGAILFLRMD